MIVKNIRIRDAVKTCRRSDGDALRDLPSTVAPAVPTSPLRVKNGHSRWFCAMSAIPRKMG
jgi:hypothetical protein